MTLIEVLASTVLLTMLAATCVPLLQGAMRTLKENTATSAAAITDLEQFADEFLADLGEQGSSLEPTETAQVIRSAHSDLGPVQVQLLLPDDCAQGRLMGQRKLRGPEHAGRQLHQADVWVHQPHHLCR